MKIVFVGSTDEKVYVEELLKMTGIQKNIISLAGKTDIQELISVIRFSRVFITNDSGPMHLALTTGTKTIALLGPCSPERYNFKGNVSVLYANLYCSPCVHEFIHPPCKGNNLCMKAISPAEVFFRLERCLNPDGELNDQPENKMKFFLSESGLDHIAGAIERQS